MKSFRRDNCKRRVGMGAAALLASAQQAGAMVQLSGSLDIDVSPSSTSSGDLFGSELLFSGKGDAEVSFQYMTDAIPSVNIALAGAGYVSSGSMPAKLSLNDTIQLTDEFINFRAGDFPVYQGNWIESGGDWTNGDYGFIGLQLNDLSTGNSHLGFIEVTTYSNTSIKIHGWGYETTPDTSITAISQIPEPAMISLVVGLFVFALIGTRKRIRCSNQ